ncbi:conserved hypothetical protein [delta proteobacterium NaphS2]|nr:conserved hypothetical protein [delta proteobacterium NaphS2]
MNKIICEADSLFQKSRLKRWLGIHRVSDAREAIEDAMYKEFEGKYRRDDSFCVWQIQKGPKDSKTNDFVFRDFLSK